MDITRLSYSFDRTEYVSNIKYLNDFISKINVENFEGQVYDIEIAANQTYKLYHRFDAIPSSRIILRQNKPSNIYDGEDWNREFIEIINPTSAIIKLKILLLR